MEFTNFMNNLSDKSDTPKNLKFAKVSGLKFMFKEPHLSQHFMNSNKGVLKIQVRLFKIV